MRYRSRAKHRRYLKEIHSARERKIVLAICEARVRCRPSSDTHRIGAD
jgi:hypothetical protein